MKNIKYEEIIFYVIFGILSTLVNILVYGLLTILINMNLMIANAISWVVTVMFAFITNRIWVFCARTHGVRDFFRQIGSFYLGRIVTLLIEEFILVIFITVLGFNSMIVKVLAQGVVIVGNYFISKIIVFRKSSN